MRKRYGRGNLIDMNMNTRFKIIVDIDGNTYSGRFPVVLSSSSVVFKIAVFKDIGSFMAQPW